MVEPKIVEGSARRRPRYPRMFFWYVPLLAVLWILLLLHLSGYDFRSVLGFGIPFLLIGIVIGVRFRDVP